MLLSLESEVLQKKYSEDLKWNLDKPQLGSKKLWVSWCIGQISEVICLRWQKVLGTESELYGAQNRKKVNFFRTIKTLQSTEKLSAGTGFIRVLFMIDQMFEFKKSELLMKTKILVLWSLSNLSFSYFPFLIMSTELNAIIEFLEDQPFHLVQPTLVPTMVILRHPVSPLCPYTYLQ